MGTSYLNWMQSISVYETASHVYLVASDESEQRYRVLKIARQPLAAPINNTVGGEEESEAMTDAETQGDRVWRLNIFEDPHVYSRKEFLCLLFTIKAACRASSLNQEELFCEMMETSTSDQFSSDSIMTGGQFSMPAATGGPGCMVHSLSGFGLLGFIRFLYGYYLLVVTQRSEIAQIGEHRIYKIEETKMIYIPGDSSINGGFVSPSSPFSGRSTFKGKQKQTSSSMTSTIFGNIFGTGGDTSFAEELRLAKLFQSIDLNSTFYYSHSYDLTNCLQDNISGDNAAISPNNRFLWNWNLVPSHFRRSNWCIDLVHGFIKQAHIVSCGMPIAIILIGRRSRFFAGTRFLKRGINLMGDVANEVETEQIVIDTTDSTLARTCSSSYVQMRGSVPLFWSQNSSKLVVGKPPLEINWEDPYYEAFGMHFASVMERRGAPIIILNLMKQHEKRRFEKQLTDGFCQGIDYLTQFTAPLYGVREEVGTKENSKEEIPPIVYIGFDMARMQKSPDMIVLDRLQPIAKACLKRTGLFFSHGERISNHLLSNICRPRQNGIVRTNCVDCLDRTNTGQFVIGHVALAYQLQALGLLLPEERLAFASPISRCLQELYEDHGDSLAMQYGGSGLVHNIETYQKRGRFRSQSRDLVKTLSRYYSNNFFDFEKQMATNLFLRVYRPGAYLKSQFHSSAEAFWRAAIAANGMPMDASAEAHMHWLDSWASLPLFRGPLTNWYPREAVLARQQHLNAWRTSPTPSTKICNDWFEELYRSTIWTHFHSMSFSQLPVSSPNDMRLESEGGLLTQVRPQHVSILNAAYRSGFMVSAQDAAATPILPGKAVKPENNEYLYLSLTNIDEDQNSSDDDSPLTPESFLVSSPLALIDRWLLDDRPPIRQHKQSQQVSSAQVLSTESPNITSNAAVRRTLQTTFSRLRFSDLTESQGRSELEKANFQVKFYPSTNHESIEDDKEEFPKKASSTLLDRTYDLCSSYSAFQLNHPSSRDMDCYRAYASLPTSAAWHDSSSLQIVSQDSMKIYSDAVNLSQNGRCSISYQSLLKYIEHQRQLC